LGKEEEKDTRKGKAWEMFVSLVSTRKGFPGYQASHIFHVLEPLDGDWGSNIPPTVRGSKPEITS